MTWIIVSQIMFCKFRKYKFCKAKYKFRSFTFVSQGFARLCKYEFHKFSQIQVSQIQGSQIDFFLHFAKFCKFSKVFMGSELMQSQL